MKTRLYLLAVIMTLFLAACKEDSSPTDPGQTSGDPENYFPVTIGTNYLFNIITTDSTGASNNGIRYTLYAGTVNPRGTQYIEQYDSVMLASTGENVTRSYFRKTDSGAFYFLDTTGLGATVGDSLLKFIEFNTELRYLTFPLAENSTWPVFKMTLKYLINLDLIEVNAAVVGKENITLNLNSGQVNTEALKIKYTLTTRIPDPDNPFSVITTNVEANSWVVKNIGVVRLHGSAAIVGAFSGGSIDFDDSTRTVTQELVQYSVK